MSNIGRKFSKIISIIAVLALLSLSLTVPVYANAPDFPAHARCHGYHGYGDQRCQDYPRYQEYSDHQGCQGPGCQDEHPGYPANQSCQGPSCPGYQVNPPVAEGNGPDSALTLGSGSATIGAGAQQWYRFPVQPPLNGDGSRGTLGMDITLTNLSGKANFQVLTSDLVNQQQNGVQYNPLGAGSENTSPQGAPIYFWHGSFNYPLTLYVLVTNNTGQPATYTLSLITRNG
ncbi:MAG: hypothetical protein U0175_02880 [Caldilineaceae bacterium]